jgi:hypothetical protein
MSFPRAPTQNPSAARRYPKRKVAQGKTVETRRYSLFGTMLLGRVGFTRRQFEQPTSRPRLRIAVSSFVICHARTPGLSRLLTYKRQPRHPGCPTR